MMTQTNQKLPIKQNDDFLCHHGTKGQKWGVRRYQEKDGSLTPLGRIHWGIGPERKDAIKKKFTLAKDNVKKLALKAKTKREENAKLRKEKQEQSIANKKAKLLGKGDPAEIHKNRALFSDAELDQAMNRIKKLQDLKSMDPKQKEAMQKLQQTQQNRQVVKDGKSTVDKIVAGVATAVSVYTAYNKIAGMVNAISGKETMKVFPLTPWQPKKDDSDNKGGGDEKKKTYDLKTSGSGSTTNASIVKRGKSDYYTTSKDVDAWNNISFSPSSWSSSSTVGSTDSYGVSDAKQKRSSQKAQSLFDVNNGYLTSSDLKAVSKGKSDTARSANTLLSMYSGQEKAKDVSFADLVENYTKTDYTGRTRTSADTSGYSTRGSLGVGRNLTEWERTTTSVAPIDITVGLGGYHVDSSGNYKKTDWETVGYDTSDISNVNTNRSAARVSFVNDIIKSGTTTLDYLQQNYAKDIGLGNEYVNSLFDAMKNK